MFSLSKIWTYFKILQRYKKCSNCGEIHDFDTCPNKENKKCPNCHEKHSAAFKGCIEFRKAKEIKEFSHVNKLSYSEAIKQFKKHQPSTSTITIENQQELQINNDQTCNEQTNNEQQMVEKIFEKVQIESTKNADL